MKIKKYKPSEIVFLGWGSLPWDKSRPFRIKGGWYDDGPWLPIEFSDVSMNGRLTLVIDESPEVKPVQTMYSFSSSNNIRKSLLELSIREGLGGDLYYVHFIDLINKRKNCPSSTIFNNVLKWMLSKNFQVVIWTGIPPDFELGTGMKYNLENAKKYLSREALTNPKIKEYIFKAPKQTQTTNRAELEKFLNDDNMIKIYQKIDLKEQAKKISKIKRKFTESFDNTDIIKVSKENMSQQDIEYIKGCLENSGQLKTTRYVETNALQWYLIKDNNKIVSFVAMKRPRKEEFDFEVGYAYTDPKYRKLGLIKKIAKEIVKDYNNKKVYMTTSSQNVENMIDKYNVNKDKTISDMDNSKELIQYSGIVDLSMINEHVFSKLLNRGFYEV